MSEEMAVTDNASSEDAKSSGEETAPNTAVQAEVTPSEIPLKLAEPPAAKEPENVPVEDDLDLKLEMLDNKIGNNDDDILDDPPPEYESEPEESETVEMNEEPLEKQEETVKTKDDDTLQTKEDTVETQIGPMEIIKDDEEEKRGVKRRASMAFSENGDEDFKGFDIANLSDLSGYNSVLERLEAEVTAATKDFTPVRNVMATPTAPPKASKRPRQDTDGSRPSSAMSSRSDENMSGDSGTAGSSGRVRRGGPSTEMSSPLLRVPLERGWRRELVYRAALDAHSRRNADIYYYTPKGKKLRSTREVAEQLSGTGLTLENFSFFKEPLGVDDPEKEIIRDAKLIRRVDSPVAAVSSSVAGAGAGAGTGAGAGAVEGKRTPKPKAPKGVSPEPPAPIISPPAKLKVKSMGSRLSNNSSATPKQNKKAPNPASAPTSAADNNNTAAWKKPSCVAARPPATAAATASASAAPPATATASASASAAASTANAAVSTALQPPPLQSRPPLLTSPEGRGTPARQIVQPCSLTCGRGVPSLACAACLCLYHPTCAGYYLGETSLPFYCKNCRKSSSPPSEPPPLTHKSGVSTSSATGAVPTPRRVPAPVPVPVPVPIPVPVPVQVPVHRPARPQEKRVLLRMKAASGGGEGGGERVWSVSAPQKVVRPPLPQSIVRLNGRRFIVVGRTVPTIPPATQHAHSLYLSLLILYWMTSEDKRRGGRIANGATSPPAASSPRRRGRSKPDDTDHFTGFYERAKQNNYNVVVQIFQYLGMRDLAHCARVCKLWKQMASTPALWRHVRMKNSHVSDWGGLCKALKSHGTKWLDLRKMLLPQNDTVFWEQFAEHIPTVDTLERIELCRCPARAVEAVCGLHGLVGLSALAIRDAALDPGPLAALTRLQELRLKSMAGLALARDLQPIAHLTALTHLSLTSIKDLGWCACDVIGQLSNLESLELGECTFRAEFADVLGTLVKLRRLRLERGTAQCAAPALLRALAHLPLLTRLELVNVDVKVGFDDALAECKNIQRLLIIPTYVSQSATTNKQVLSGVLRLKDTLTHLMWGVTIELLRVTELFIDQCEQSADKRRDIGECIPVLKPVPGCRLPDHRHVHGPPQVEILPLPTLQRLLSAQLPHTKLKLLRIPFHATWRQSLADFQ